METLPSVSFRRLVICSLLSYSGTRSAGMVQLHTLPSTNLTSSSVVPVANSLPPLMMAWQVAMYSTSGTMCTYCYSNYTDEAGNEVNLTGLASIAYEKERQADASGIVTPERVREAVEIYQACLTSYGVTESYDLPEGVYEKEILPIAPSLSPLLSGNIHKYRSSRRGAAAVETLLRGRSDR